MEWKDEFLNLYISEKTEDFSKSLAFKKNHMPKKYIGIVLFPVKSFNILIRKSAKVKYIWREHLK